MPFLRWYFFFFFFFFSSLGDINLFFSPSPADDQFFPCVYDIKYLMKSCKTLKGGLQEVADNLAVLLRFLHLLLLCPLKLNFFLFFRLRELAPSTRQEVTVSLRQ